MAEASSQVHDPESPQPPGEVSASRSGGAEGPRREKPTQSAATAWWAVAGLAALLAAVLYPVLQRMAWTWSIDPDYSHGFLIAPLAIYFAWERRSKLARARIQGSWWGLAPLLIGLATLAVGRFGVELMNMRVSFVFSLIGIVLLVLGRDVFRILRFPLCFLFLMVPLPQSLVNVIAFPLQLIAADTAVQALHLFGYPVFREGNILHLPQTTLFVAEACSGLRSLMALATLGILFAYFFRRNWIERTILVVSTIPIAVAVNALRVALTGVLTFHWGPEAAKGMVHEFQGFITFGAAFFLLLLEAQILSGIRRLWLRRRAVAAS